MTVRWTTADGRRHAADVPVAGRVPDLDRFSGTLWLKYTDGDDWHVVPVTYDEADRRAIAHLPEVP